MSGKGRVAPRGYSALQIGLHWTIAALIIFQLLLNEGMQDAFGDRMDRETVDDMPWAALHIAVGMLVLVLAAVRLAVRLKRGAPRPHEESPKAVHWAGYLTHFGLYLLIFAMPLTGAVAWFGYNELAAEAHELGRTALILLISLHVLGAFAEHFFFRNDTLMRMLRPDKGRVPLAEDAG